MKKYFSPRIECYFLSWLLKPTWSSLHGFDKDRFYAFMKAYFRYAKRKDKNRLVHTIRQAVADFYPTMKNPQALELYIQKVELIFEYESIKFPEPLVENRNYYSVRSSLQSGMYYDGEWKQLTNEEIETTIKEEFEPGADIDQS